MTCEVLRRHVDAIVDGEVDPTTQIEFEHHLSSCAPCRIHLAFAQSFKQRVKDAAAELPPAPPDLAMRIQRALDAEDQRRAAGDDPRAVSALDAPLAVGASAAPRGPLGLSGIKLLPIRARYAVPAAAAAVALAVLAAREGGNPMVDEGRLDASAANAMAPGAALLEDVVDRRRLNHPVEVRGEPRHVTRWFDGKLAFDAQPPEFESPNVRFIGARISNVREREAAQFFYEVDHRRVTVIAFEQPWDSVAPHVHTRNIAGRGVYFGYARGRTVPMVQHHGVTYALVGDLDERQLMRLAASARVSDQ
jgi:anti-sigma factor RsiW